MRVASRHMPKYRAKPLGFVGRGFLAALVAGATYLAFDQPKLAAAALAVLLAAILLSLPAINRERTKLRMLAAAREGHSICEFAREFDLRSVDPWVIRAVYEQVQRQLAHVHPAFPLHASDRLKEDLFLDDDDLDMSIAVEVEQRTGRSLEKTSANPYLGKVRTVCDLVMFFQAQAPRGAA